MQAIWAEEGLLAIAVRLPDHRWVAARSRMGVHPVLGPCHLVTLEHEDREPEERSWFSAVDYRRPTFIPAMDRPAALPGGAGSAILNWIAWCAELAGVEALTYRGPYPTNALFDSLMECFEVDDVVSAHQRFVAQMAADNVRGVVREVPVPFRPAPFARWWPRPDVCVQGRHAGLERVWLFGRSYAAGSPGARQLLRVKGGWRAVVVLAGTVWHTVAAFDEQGDLVGQPQRPPAVDDDAALPPVVVDAVGRIVRARRDSALRDALVRVVRDTPVRWGDAGADAALLVGGTVVVHGAMRPILRQMSVEGRLDALAQALEAVWVRLAVGDLQDRLRVEARPTEG